MSLWEVKRSHGHVWLLYRGVVIWKLSSDGTHSHLFQTAPRTTELLIEADRDIPVSNHDTNVIDKPR